LARSKVETFLEVLEIIKGGISKPTHIMSRASLSWQPLMRILKSMMSQGLVKETVVTGDKRSTKIYELTMKGDEIVKHFRGGG